MMKNFLKDSIVNLYWKKNSFTLDKITNINISKGDENFLKDFFERFLLQIIETNYFNNFEKKFYNYNFEINKYTTNTPKKTTNQLQIHHESTTKIPQIHHKSTTKIPQIYHKSTTNPPQIYHESATNPPQIHHKSTTNSPQIHHKSTTNSPRKYHKYTIKIPPQINRKSTTNPPQKYNILK